MLDTAAIIDMIPTVAVTIIHMGFTVLPMGIQAMGIMADGITGDVSVRKRKEVKQSGKDICLAGTAAYMAERDRWRRTKMEKRRWGRFTN